MHKRTVKACSHLKFIRRDLFDKQWVVMYQMSAFTLRYIWETFAWTEMFNNGLCAHFSRLSGLKSSRNSSPLLNRRCE